MFPICHKELSRFFSSLTAYIAIVLFMLLCGVFLFVLPGSNIFDNSYASLDAFFSLAPWVLLFLVPAITMHSFSDEYRTGTFELLKTKPVSAAKIAGGKYLAVIILLLPVLLPTLVYVACIKSLSATHSIDAGGIAGSYLGLYLLAAVFAAISICCSSFTSNAVVAFLVSAFICLLIYFGFDAVSRIPFLAGNADYYIQQAGIDFHYHSISRGVVDTRDLIYFGSLIYLSLFITAKNVRAR